MKAFFPCDPIADSNTLNLRFTVADARLLVEMVATDPAFLSKLSGRLLAQVSWLQSYLADRDNGEHCFVSMGDPFKEAHVNGWAVRNDPDDAAKLDFRNGSVTEGGRLADHGREGGRVVAMTHGRADGDATKPTEPGERRRFVHPVAYTYGNDYQYEMVRKAYGYVEEVPGAPDRYTVVNPNQPTVYRPDYTTAVITCYLRGKRAAEDRAARKAASADSPDAIAKAAKRAAKQATGKGDK